MKATQLVKRKIILIMLIISMLIPYVPVYMPVAKAVNEQVFNYTGGVQTYTVPVSGYYQLSVFGADGGYDRLSNGQDNPYYYGGKGGYATGWKHLEKRNNSLYNCWRKRKGL